MSNAKGMRPVATESASHYTTKLTYSGSNLEYLGKADIGTATTSSGWQIKKFTYDGSNNLTDIQYAEGTDAFDKIWDNRIGYSYS
jgi:hypothetical protein